MMDCNECSEHLIDYASRELDEPPRVAVARHLTDCPSCAMEYCRLQADLEGIIEAHSESPRPHVFHQLRRQVAAQTRPRWTARAWRILARPIPMYGALLASLIPAGLWLASLGHPPTPAHSASDSPPGRPPTLTVIDYDATALPSPHRGVL